MLHLHPITKNGCKEVENVLKVDVIKLIRTDEVQIDA